MMKIIFQCLLTVSVLLFSANAFAQSEEEKVKAVIQAYKSGIESLSAEGMTELFTKDSKVFESGGVEGSFEHYLDHHLGPELHHFTSFKFSDYKTDVEVDLPYAFTTETYIYTIVLKKDGHVIEKKGVATSILKKIEGEWKIVQTHSSSRAVKKKKKA